MDFWGSLQPSSRNKTQRYQRFHQAYHSRSHSYKWRVGSCIPYSYLMCKWLFDTQSILRLYFDGSHTFCFGWVLWGTVYGHLTQTGTSPFKWQEGSQALMNEIRQVLHSDDYFSKLIAYYAEEPNVDPATIDTREEYVSYRICSPFRGCWQVNPRFYTSCVQWVSRICECDSHAVGHHDWLWPGVFIGEMYGAEFFKSICDAVEPLWRDENRFKQRACLEVISGMVNGEQLANTE